MTDELTPRLKAPLMAAGQAQKHVTHNEAIMVLDALAQLSVVSSTSTPPSSPVADSVYIIGASPVGVWAGKATQIARFQDGAWAYTVPQIGWRAWVQDVAQLYVFTGSAWMNYNSLALNNVPMLGVNTTANSTTKFISKSDANLFDTVTGSVRVNVNKAATGDTASFIFQKNFSGRAEFGLMGVDTFGVKVSADGTSWKQAVSVDGAGCVSFPSGVTLQNGKNLIINGACFIWQRGTSFAISAASSAYTADRWMGYADPNVTNTVSRQAFTAGSAPVSGQENAFFLRCSGVISTAGWAFGVRYRIEDVRVLAGRKVTVSFWAKASVAQYLYFLAFQYFGSGGSSTVTAASTGANITTAWARYSYTFDMPSIAGATIGGGSYTEIHPLRSFTASDIDIWGLQVEEGAYASAFDARPIAQEFAMCQRYYEIFGNGIMGAFGTTTAATMGVNFKAQKRATPTIGATSGTHDFEVPSVAILSGLTPTLTLGTGSTTGILVAVGGFTGRTVKDPVIGRTNFGYADAEL